MGIFDFLKKTEATKPTEITESNKEAEEAKGNACLGVLGFFPMEEKGELLIAANLEGSLKVGDCLLFCNPDQGMDALGSVVVKKLSCHKEDVEALNDEELIYLEVDKVPSLDKLKKGSVLYSQGVEEEKRSSTYGYALYRAFVTIQEGKVGDEDYQALSLEDSIEILQAFLWDCRQNQETESEESYQANTRKLERLAEIVKDKLLVADSVYAVYSEKTGEPYLFSTTYDRGEEGYLCTDPMIMLFTPRCYHRFKETIDSRPKSVVKLIENTEDKKGIENFLGTAFYLNGALGAFFNSKEVSIAASVLVPKPDFSDLPEIQVPVMNPDVVRWMLLMGQLDSPTTEDEEVIYKLYYKFFSMAVPKAKFLLPLEAASGFPEGGQEANSFVLEKSAKFNIPTGEGKNGRNSVPVFTDWKRLRMVFDEKWNGMIENAGNMIEFFDYAINPTEYYEAGAYVGLTAFKEMQKLSEEQEGRAKD
ncbi:SseB family protein [Streptococcus infantis]|uniref:SseB family protein n=1 Tax=Streptococcus infantis TaxID=68892 RepID=UPI0026E22098|nr:SseB family protein [Streptococcus infantis]MDO6229034.1 SseB family protein [Streptococcus infantis]